MYPNIVVALCIYIMYLLILSIICYNKEIYNGVKVIYILCLFFFSYYRLNKNLSKKIAMLYLFYNTGGFSLLLDLIFLIYYFICLVLSKFAVCCLILPIIIMMYFTSKNLWEKYPKIHMFITGVCLIILFLSIYKYLTEFKYILILLKFLLHKFNYILLIMGGFSDNNSGGSSGKGPTSDRRPSGGKNPNPQDPTGPPVINPSSSEDEDEDSEDEDSEDEDSEDEDSEDGDSEDENSEDGDSENGYSGNEDSENEDYSEEAERLEEEIEEANLKLADELQERQRAALAAYVDDKIKRYNEKEGEDAYKPSEEQQQERREAVEKAKNFFNNMGPIVSDEMLEEARALEEEGNNKRKHTEKEYKAESSKRQKE